MRKIFLLTVGLALLGGLYGCRTTEANYRAAYEKAVAGREQGTDIDSTIYGNVRRQMRVETVKGPDGNAYEVKTQLVKVTPEGGGIHENLREYNAVVGQFKQRFNAVSLRERLVDLGYPEAFVVQTAEPYYYIVAASRPDVSQVAEILTKIKSNPPVPLKSPCPFILKATRNYHK